MFSEGGTGTLEPGKNSEPQFTIRTRTSNDICSDFTNCATSTTVNFYDLIAPHQQRFEQASECLAVAVALIQVDCVGLHVAAARRGGV
jgi:hypothetical protein